nr:MAG TPA_asm: hypothetical protein [Caudoviricetes sp.]
MFNGFTVKRTVADIPRGAECSKHTTSWGNLFSQER